MKFALTLIALVAGNAAYGDSGSAETQESGYEAAPAFQGYTPFQTKVCLGSCPSGSKCQNKATGACSAPIVRSAPVQSYAAQSYAAPAQSEEEAAYRSLQYAQATEESSYDNAAYESAEGCPVGTINLDRSHVRNSTVFWVGFALLFIPGLYFFWAAFADPRYATIADGSCDSFFMGELQFSIMQTWRHGSKLGTKFNAVDKVQQARAICGAICWIASLAYLVMALGYGYTTRCEDGRQFFYARYIDWAITTPLLLYKCMSYLNFGLTDMCSTGFTKSDLNKYVAAVIKKATVKAQGTVKASLKFGASKEENVLIAAHMKKVQDDLIDGTVGTYEMYFIFAMDILMIVAGLIASLVGGAGNDKWAFFGFAMLCFIPVIYYLFMWNDDKFQSMCCSITGTQNITFPFKKTYNQIITLTICMWALYPVIWVLAEGTNTISAQAEAICYTVLDVISKSVFGFILCGGDSLFHNAPKGIVIPGGSMI